MAYSPTSSWAVAASDGARVQGRHARLGFSLLEIALCIVIIGIGITAIMAFMASATRANRISSQNALAIQYARAGWETVPGQGFAQIVAQTAANTPNWAANPPTAAPGLSTPAPGYTRRIWIENVDVNNLTGPALALPVTNAMRVNVAIYYNNASIYQQSWFLTNPTP